MSSSNGQKRARIGVLRNWLRGFLHLAKLLKARQLYAQAGVEVHTELNRLFIHAALRSIILFFGFVLIFVLIFVVSPLKDHWLAGISISAATPVPPTPVVYQILVVRPDDRIEKFECGETMPLLSNEETIYLAISPIQDGESRWESLVQRTLGSNSPVPYTPREFIENFDIIFYYRNGVKQCELVVLKADAP